MLACHHAAALISSITSKKGNLMSDPESINPEFREVLRLLILLNSSVKFIVLRLKELASEKILTAAYTDRLTKATQEVDKFLNTPDIAL